MYLIHYHMVGDGGSVREVMIRAVIAESEDAAIARLYEWYGRNRYVTIIKVEHVARNTEAGS